jgi:hypothetical protein
LGKCHTLDLSNCGGITDDGIKYLTNRKFGNIKFFNLAPSHKVKNMGWHIDIIMGLNFNHIF